MVNAMSDTEDKTGNQTYTENTIDLIISHGLCTANMLLLIKRDLINGKQNARCDGLTKWR